MSTTQTKRTLISIGLVAFLFGSLALLNRFPLSCPDTGTYIQSGWGGFFPEDRPIFYGWFLRHLSLDHTLWLPVVAQCLLASWLLWLFGKSFFSSAGRELKFITTASVLTLCTAVSLRAGMLMPDIFTAFLFLSLVMLLWGRNLNRMEVIALSLVFFVSCLVHSSHLFILGFSLLLLLLVKLLFRKLPVALMNKRNLLPAGLFVAAAFTLPFTHYLYRGTFRFSDSGHVFLTARLNEQGLLRPYLDEYCAEKNYSICEWKDSIIQIDLLWDVQHSPIYKAGGFVPSGPEYSAMLGHFFTRPSHLFRFAISSWWSAWAQFFSFEILVQYEAGALSINTSPANAIQYHLPHEYQPYLDSEQNRAKLNLDALNNRHQAIMLLSLGLAGFFFVSPSLRRQLSPEVKLALLFFFLFAWANAWVCSNVSTVAPRFQNRISWLLPMMCMFVLLDSAWVSKLWARLSASPEEKP